MQRPRVALCNAATNPAATARNFRRELDADLVEFHAPSGAIPDDPGEYDAAVVTGSAASVYADESWTDDLVDWVEAAVDADLPLLGVCFGHQVLATAIGGTVEPMGEYEIGYRTVEHDGTDPLLDGIEESFTVFTTHSDVVTGLPEGARVFAENDYGIHGFRYGRAWGVQFHPEYDRGTAERVTEGKDELEEARKARVLDGVTPEAADRACEAKRLFDNFLALATADRAGPRAADD